MTNEQAIEAFLQSNKEVKANNITTHYNENDGENLLRQYGTVIATRKGKKVTFTGKKYSKTTAKLTNDIKYLANKYGFVIEKSKKFAKGSNVDSENAEMVLNENKQIKHHTEELPNAIKGKHVPAWVVAKVHESASDLSDATHYLDGAKYGKGGNTENGKTWLDGIEYLFC